MNSNFDEIRDLNHSWQTDPRWQGIERTPRDPVEVWEEEARSILSSNDSPDLHFGYSVNPYRGCQHACAYCYARPTHEYLGFGQNKLFDAHQILMDQREFTVNHEEDKLYKRQATLLKDRDKMLRFNERRTLDLDIRGEYLDIREKALKNMATMSFIDRVKLVFGRSK